MTHLLSGAVDKATFQSTAFNQDIDDGGVTSNGYNRQHDKDEQRSGGNETLVGPSDIMTFTMQENTVSKGPILPLDNNNQHENATVRQEIMGHSSMTRNDDLTNLILDQTSQFNVETASQPTHAALLQAQADASPAYIPKKYSSNVRPSQTTRSPRSTNTAELAKLQKKQDKEMFKLKKKQQAMEKIFQLTDKGGKAAKILQKHW